MARDSVCGAALTGEIDHRGEAAVADPARVGAGGPLDGGDDGCPPLADEIRHLGGGLGDHEPGAVREHDHGVRVRLDDLDQVRVHVQLVVGLGDAMDGDHTGSFRGGGSGGETDGGAAASGAGPTYTPG